MSKPFQLPGIGGKILGKVDKTVKRTHEGVKEQVTKVDQKVKEKLSEADQKIKKKILKKFLEQFTNIKKMNLPIEETLPRLQRALEEFESMILRSLPNEVESKEESLKNGSEGIAGFGDTWEQLHKNSKKFLKTGEFLYSYLCESSNESYDEIDYSPVTLEYCKAFENELGMKMFNKYKQPLSQMIDSDKNGYDKICNLCKSDSSWNYKKTTYDFFRSYLKKDDKKTPELGKMQNTIATLKGELPQKSRLFEQFRIYLINDWDQSFLFDKNNPHYINKKCEDILEFRNGSAHTTVQSKFKSEDCRMKVLSYLPIMLKNYKGKL